MVENDSGLGSILFSSFSPGYGKLEKFGLELNSYWSIQDWTVCEVGSRAGKENWDDKP